MADALNETAAALNESAKNATERTPATPEGMAVAYGSLLIMALLPIFFGSYRSVKYQAEQKVESKNLYHMAKMRANLDLKSKHVFFSLGGLEQKVQHRSV